MVKSKETPGTGRGRGRPKKLVRDQPEESSTTLQTGRGRGRPKKDTFGIPTNAPVPFTGPTASPTPIPQRGRNTRSGSSLIATPTSPILWSNKRKRPSEVVTRSDLPPLASMNAIPSPKRRPGPGRPSLASLQQAQTPRILTTRPKTVLTLLACGTGDCGELGLGVSSSQRSAPSPRIVPSCDPMRKGSFNIVQVAVGGMHTVALTSEGRIVTWGVNDKGALGRDTSGWTGGERYISCSPSSPRIGGSGSSDGESDDGELNPLEATPTAIPLSSLRGKTNFTQVAAGNSCSFALTDAGEVWGWGAFLNRKGDSTFYPHPSGAVETQPTPIQVPHLPPVTSIVAGIDHALALSSPISPSSNPTVLAWGIGEQNQFGRRLLLRSDSRHLPHHIELFRRIPLRIFTGSYHSFAIDSSDNVWGWGLNSYGQTGDPSTVGKTESAAFHPTKIPELCGKGVKVIAGGQHHSVAVTEGGDAYIWGRMDGGQLGIRFTETELTDGKLIVKDERGKPRICLKPTLVRIFEEVEEENTNKQTATKQPTLALSSRSKKGRKPSMIRSAQAALPTGKQKRNQQVKFVHASCTTESTMLISSTGDVYGTGFNSVGQLGLGHEDDVETFTRLDRKSVKGKKIVWSGCGGQFSILAYPAETVVDAEKQNK